MPGIFPAAFRGHDGSVAVYFEAAAVITVLCCSGRCSNCVAAKRPAAPSVRCSISPRAPRAVSMTAAMSKISRLDKVVVGDRCALRPGEKVPVDGEVFIGRGQRR